MKKKKEPGGNIMFECCCCSELCEGVRTYNVLLTSWKITSTSPLRRCRWKQESCKNIQKCTHIHIHRLNFHSKMLMTTPNHENGSRTRTSNNLFDEGRWIRRRRRRKEAKPQSLYKLRLLLQQSQRQGEN